MNANTKSEGAHTLWLGLLLLFFIQVLGVWFESLYRMILIKISVGWELGSIALLFLPVFLLLIKEKQQRLLLPGSLWFFLLVRALCPLLGASSLVVAAGLGTGAFLIFLCGIFSNRCRLNAHLGLAAGIAVTLSVLFRGWGSSADISMEGKSAILGWLLVLITLYLTRGALAEEKNTATENIAPNGTRYSWGLGLFSNFAMIYLVLSSPAVVSAWSGANFLVATASLMMGMVAVVLLRTPMPKYLMLLWNMLFVALLAGGLYWCAPLLPLTFDAPACTAYPLPGYVHILFYLMLLLSPVVLLNLTQLGSLSSFPHPRAAAGPVLLGTAWLFTIILLLIFTNIWGYVSLIGGFFRNRFYLPFLMAGAGMIVPVLISKGDSRPLASDVQHGKLALVTAFIGALALAGIFWNASRPYPVATPGHTLTIMTYNIQQGSTVNGGRSYRQQLELMRKVNADIIGLQECDTARPSGGNTDCVRYFADGLNYHAYYGPSTVAGTFGTAILSRFPLENPRTFFSFSNTDEVGTAVAEVNVGGARIAFFNSHPDGNNHSHAAHAQALLEHAAPYERVIAVGDYNCTRHDSWYERIAAVMNNSWLSVHDVNEPVGEPYSCPIDHIFLSPGFRTLESHYLPPPESFTDHPAHWSVVAWN